MTFGLFFCVIDAIINILQNQMLLYVLYFIVRISSRKIFCHHKFSNGKNPYRLVLKSKMYYTDLVKYSIAFKIYVLYKCIIYVN